MKGKEVGHSRTVVREKKAVVSLLQKNKRIALKEENSWGNCAPEWKSRQEEDLNPSRKFFILFHVKRNLEGRNAVADDCKKGETTKKGVAGVPRGEKKDLYSPFKLGVSSPTIGKACGRRDGTF